MKKPDRRKARTQQLLRDALIDLILEKGYDAVTVQDITDKANLGRATFYLHYLSKEDLLMQSLVEMFDDLKAQAEPIPKEGLLSGDMPMRGVVFQHALEHRDLYRVMLLNQQGTASILKGVREYLAGSIQERLEGLVPQNETALPIEITANYLAGAMLSLVSWWLEHDTTYSAEEMAAMFRQLALPALSAAFQWNKSEQTEK